MLKPLVQNLRKKMSLDTLSWAFLLAFYALLLSALAGVVFASVYNCIREENDPNRVVEDKNITGVKGFYQGHEYLFLCLKYENKCGVVHNPYCAMCNVPQKKVEQKSETKKNRYLVLPTVAEPQP